jgi:hypothetical protein
MTRRLGVRWEPPEHGIAEIAGFDAGVLAEFSQRTADVERRLDEKLCRFRRDLGREPTAKERWRLERESVVDSRPSKRHGLTATEFRREGQDRARTIVDDPERLADHAVPARCVDGRYLAW